MFETMSNSMFGSFRAFRGEITEGEEPKAKKSRKNVARDDERKQFKKPKIEGYQVRFARNFEVKIEHADREVKEIRIEFWPVNLTPRSGTYKAPLCTRCDEKGERREKDTATAETEAPTLIVEGSASDHLKIRRCETDRIRGVSMLKLLVVGSQRVKTEGQMNFYCSYGLRVVLDGRIWGETRFEVRTNSIKKHSSGSNALGLFYQKMFVFREGVVSADDSPSIPRSNPLSPFAKHGAATVLTLLAFDKDASNIKEKMGIQNLLIETNVENKL